jgi:hypothetical protein
MSRIEAPGRHDGADIPTDARARLRPNVVAIAQRQARRWSQRRQAREFQTVGARLDITISDSLDTVIKQIHRVERGVTAVPDPPYLQVWCAVFDMDAAELFGHLDAPVLADAGRATFAATSHKFIPAFVGPDAARALACGASAEPERDSRPWQPCHRAALAHPAGTADLHVWPFGVAVVHLREDLQFPTLAQLAVWRRCSYPASRAWADAHLESLCGVSAASRYTLSAYWLTRPKWSGEQLDVAMRLLSMPSVLLDRDDTMSRPAAATELLSSAELVERTLLSDHTIRPDRPDLVAFGTRGVSVGYASWSGVAYHPVAPRRALTIDDLASCELLVQAVWCYTGEILRQVEDGVDPIVPTAYGRRFLRAVRSRLTAPRPLKSGQHASMRDAVLVTSGVTRQLDSAMEALRDTDGG